ncbi:MAG: helicase-associated domain-containing protein [Spirochaetia bacterium]
MADFKSTLLTLGDDAFFELIRNYLGPIKTPFNKHTLIAQLMAFLRKDKIQDRIISLIDEEDAEILTAVWLLDEPSHDDLFAFLEPDHSFLGLHSHLLNLEDRLLLYRDAEYIRLNPELEPRILNDIVHPSRLFHGKHVKRVNGEPSWIDDTLLVSFFSFLLEKPELYRADGSLRKRSAAAIARRIPVLMERISSPDQPATLRIDFLVEALLGLGLLVEEGTRLRPIVHSWRRWTCVSPLARLAQIAGAGATPNDGERSDTVLATEAIVASLPTGLALDPSSVARLAAAATGVPAESALKAIRSMERMGLLRRNGSLLVKAWPVETSRSPKPLVIQANFELTLPAEVEFVDALFVAEVGELVRHDRYPRFELTKERVAAAMRGGLGASRIADKLAQLADDHLPQNVAISIRTWEEEYESLRLYRGVVLQVQESRRHTVEHSPAIRRFIVQELAPGTYLVDESDVPALQEGLREAGVQLVPELPPADPAGLAAWQDIGPSSATGERVARIARLISESVEQPAAPLDSSGGLQDELASALAERSLPAEQRRELAARIQHKLILSERQLKSGALKAEKTEAKGLDYSGKVRIIEQSLSTGGFLEVIERTADGTPKRRLVEPSSLRKEGGELILEGQELPNRVKVELPVSKLGLVRRLRATLFRRRPTD